MVGSVSPDQRCALYFSGLDALEQRVEEERLLTIARNLQPPSVHGPVQGQTPIDKQDIVPRVAAKRHVGTAVGYRLYLKAVLADQYVLPYGSGAGDVEAITDRRRETRCRTKGVGQPPLCQAHQHRQRALGHSGSRIEGRTNIPPMHYELLEPEAHVITCGQDATTMEAGLVPVLSLQAH